MPFLLLLVLALISLQPHWPLPPFGLPWAGAFAAGLWLVWIVGLVELLLRRVRGLVQRDPMDVSRIQRRYFKWRRWHFLLAVLTFLGVVFFLGWGWTADQLCIVAGQKLPVTELLLLAPLALTLTLTWARFYDLDRAFFLLTRPQQAFPGRCRHVWNQARMHLILLAPPMLLLIGQQTVLWVFPALRDDGRLLPILGVVLLASAFIGIPWLLRLILGLRPLEPGPLRDRLMATAKRLRFRFTDILVWHTGQTVANAMVTGPLPVLRYVVLTDYLIAEMTPDEVEAVFGHEVGHVKHHHMFLYFFFMIASLVMLVGVWAGLESLVKSSPLTHSLAAFWPELTDWIITYDALAVLPFMGFLGVYIFVVFGFLSRRCERQADIFGCRTVSCAAFISALEKVALLNGISRDRPGVLSWWLHSTIGRRVEFLQRLAADPRVEPRFQRSLVLVKMALVLAIVVVLWLIGPKEVWSILATLNQVDKTTLP